MLKIAPFQGVRYNPRKVGGLARVVTQPYDIISPEGQAAYYRKSPWNYVRLIFGRVQSSDSRSRNRYTRARKHLTDWLRSGVLVQDGKPALYPYLQEFTLDGKRGARWGLITLVSLDSTGIHPHEHTRPGPKQDRVRILQTVQAVLSPIFGLVPDSDRRFRQAIQSKVRGLRPAARVRLDGVENTLWRIEDPAWIARMQRLLAPKPVVIADGHHRFEAAKIYRGLKGRRQGAAWNFTMFDLTSAAGDDPGLLPTHRMLTGFPEAGLPGALKRWRVTPAGRGLQNVEKLSRTVERLKDRRRLGVGLALSNGHGGFLIEPKGRGRYHLDVEWLHEELLPALYGSDRSGKKRATAAVEASLAFTQDLKRGWRHLRDGSGRALFVMQPPRTREVFDWARRGRRMPGKTTYFTPKPIAGLVAYLHA